LAACVNDLPAAETRARHHRIAGTRQTIRTNQAPRQLSRLSRSRSRWFRTSPRHETSQDTPQALATNKSDFAYGNAGIVELVALCGLYGIMGDMITAFDIKIEKGLPAPPF